MSSNIVLSTKVHLPYQMLQDTLASPEAMEVIYDWIREYLDATANVRSWTPFWKEIELRRPGNTYIAFRFRLGAPLQISREHGWSFSEAERADLERRLLTLLDELGKALSQRRVADAIQSRYPDATRTLRDDDTILMQFRVTPPMASPQNNLKPSADMAMIIYPHRQLDVFARCGNEVIGRAAIRRLLADLQVAGVPVEKCGSIVVQR